MFCSRVVGFFTICKLLLVELKLASLVWFGFYLLPFCASDFAAELMRQGFLFFFSTTSFLF